MGNRRAKKVAAAVAAVLQHVAPQEVHHPPMGERPPTPPAPGPSPWSLSGRQDGMFLRTLWQRRLSRSW